MSYPRPQFSYCPTIKIYIDSMFHELIFWGLNIKIDFKKSSKIDSIDSKGVVDTNF